ncbi:MAG: GDSL family lipase [Lachnospiraceae bacterium]|nr:GDSL family lipase [Lachnospiraceae bacterium]MBQ7781522.1 GDSL family lipase [Lachnospiraceae bacterium]
MNPNTNLKTYSLKEVPYYKLHGRTDTTQYPLPLFWNGSAIEVNVTGTELWIDIDVDFDFHEPWVGTSIDGAVMSRQMLMPGSYSICLFRNMTQEPVKNVRFFRELQAMSEDNACHVLIRGFQTDGEFSPVADKPIKLEFIGDSITSGEGTYGAKGDYPWITMFMSSSKHYATMTGEALNADIRLISQGGWGVLCGWDNDPRHSIPTRYEAICGLAEGEFNEQLGAQKPNPFDQWQPDAVIVNLGTNDASAFEQPAFTVPETGEVFKQRKNEDGSFNTEDVARFEKAVVDFLYMLRRNNPNSHIVWTYGMLGYNLSLPIAHAVSTYRAETGDNKAYFLQLPNTTEETIGSRFHPGVKSHERASKVLIEYLQELLQIPQ